MATAVTMQPTPIRPNLVPIAPARPQNKFQPSHREPLIRPKPMNVDAKDPPSIVAGGKDRPCDACRKRKSRCAMNEITNKCYSCDFHRQDCTFLDNPPPRKKRAEASVSSYDVGDRRAAQQPRRSSNSSSNVSLNGYAQPPAQSNNTSGSSTPAQTFGHVSSYQLSQHIGKTTELEPLLLSHLPLDHNDESRLPNVRLRKYADDGTFMKIVDEEPTLAESQAAALQEIEAIVAPHGPELVNKFFYFVHPTFPIVNEAEFRELYRSRKRLCPILLTSIYILGLNWWEVDGLISARRPDVNRLETITTTLLLGSLFRPQISTIQAGLLLSQRPHLNSSALTSQLVTAGFELGLHQDCSLWRISSSERGLRKRLAWALYMQDKWCALVHGRPSHIVITNWTVKPLTEEDFENTYWGRSAGEDVPEGGNGALLFSQMISLTAILSDILETFYTLQAAEDFSTSGKNRTRLILEKAKPVQIKLKDWFACLPACLKMDATPTGQWSSNGYLHLAYFSAEITLHRCIIRSLDTTTADPYLFHICRSAAKTRLISAMDFVNRLRQTHLKAFWYFPSRTNFALVGAFGMLLRATASTMEEEEFYRNRLEEYRWTLSISSKSADFVKFAVESLDSAAGLLKNVPDKPPFSELMVSSTGVGVGAGVGGLGSNFASQDHPMLDASDAPAPSGYFEAAGRLDPVSTAASGLASPATSSPGSSHGQGVYASPYRAGVAYGAGPS